MNRNDRAGDIQDNIQKNSGSRQGDVALMLAFTGLALLLRVWQINADLWLDEITTVIEYMRLSPIEAAFKIKSANQHFLKALGQFCFHIILTCKSAGNANYYLVTIRGIQESIQHRSNRRKHVPEIEVR